MGNTYNATVEIPLPTGEYYSDINAEVQSHNVLQAILKEGVASLGLQITFAIGASLMEKLTNTLARTSPIHTIPQSSELG